jgi:hypothetical protein
MSSSVVPLPTSVVAASAPATVSPLRLAMLNNSDTLHPSSPQLAPSVPKLTLSNRATGATTGVTAPRSMRECLAALRWRVQHEQSTALVCGVRVHVRDVHFCRRLIRWPTHAD